MCTHIGRSSSPCNDEWEKLCISSCTSQKRLSMQHSADQPCAAIWTEVCWPSLLKTKEITRRQVRRVGYEGFLPLRFFYMGSMNWEGLLHSFYFDLLELLYAKPFI